MGGAFAVADTAECDMSSNTHWSHEIKFSMQQI